MPPVRHLARLARSESPPTSPSMMEDTSHVRPSPMDSADLAKLAQQAIRPIAGGMSVMDGRQNAMGKQGNNILQELKVVVTTLSSQQSMLSDVICDQLRRTTLMESEQRRLTEMSIEQQHLNRSTFEMQQQHSELFAKELMVRQEEMAQELKQQRDHQAKIMTEVQTSVATQDLLQSDLENA